MTQDEFKSHFSAALAEISQLGPDVLAGVSEYAALRAAHLLTVVDEPGYPQAIRAEAASVALKAAELAVEGADLLEDRARAMLAGLLRMGVAALA